MEKLQAQASKLWQLLFSAETTATYQKMLALTGVILTETAQLLWLLFCSVFVLGAWVGKNAMVWGRDTRSWLNKQTTASSPASSPASTTKAVATGQALLNAGQSGAYYLLDKAYEQLGLDKPLRPKPAVTSPALSSSQPIKQTHAAKTPSSSPELNAEPAIAKKETASETRIRETQIAPETPDKSAVMGDGKGAEEKAVENAEETIA